MALLDDGGAQVATVKPNWDVRTIHPEEAPVTLGCELAHDKLNTGTYRLALRIPNPLPKGKPIRMANATQEEEWLILGDWEKRT